MELQWCMTLEDCTPMPLIVMVKLVALGEELEDGELCHYSIYRRYVCRVLTRNLIPNGA